MNSQPADTNLGGSDRRFPETTWELVTSLRNREGTGYRMGLEDLCRRYWKPVYGYVRTSWAKSNEDAKDLTQAFFLWLAEGAALARFEPELGSFRRYLKVVLRRFVGHHETALHRLKRGGGMKVVSLDGDPALPAEIVSDPRAVDPERVFEQMWLTEVVNRGVDRVRSRSRSGERALAFRVYEAFAMGQNAEQPAYAELASRFNLKESEVKRYLFMVREQIRSEIRAELAQTTLNPQELEEEWRALFGS